MAKNTIIAFVLMLLAIQFFTGTFYNEKILGRKPAQTTATGVNDRQRETGAESKAPEGVDNKKSETVLQSAVPDTAVTAISTDTVWVETDRMICGISERGGTIVSIRMKDYRYNVYDPKKKKYVPGDKIELIGSDKNGGGNLSIDGQTFDNRLFKYAGTEKNIKVSGMEKELLSFIYTGSNGKTIKKTYTFVNRSYTFRYEIDADELQGKRVAVGWKGGINETEENAGQSGDPITVHLYDGKNVDHLTSKKKEQIDQTGTYAWAGITSKYFLVALIPDSVIDTDIKITPFLHPVMHQNQETDEKKKEEMNYALSLERFISGTTDAYTVYAGPTQLNELEAQDIGLQKVLFMGYRWFLYADKWFPPVCEFVLWLLIEIYKFAKDYGIVIILLTILLKVVLVPLTLSSTKSMSKFRDLQPEINKIRAKYKGNVQTMNKKIMEFYRKEGVNPFSQMGGCFPMLLQMPIFFALYVVLRKAIEMRGATTFMVPWVNDLSQPEVLFDLGFSIPFYGNHLALMPILFGILMYFQSKQTMHDPNQKMILYIMPVMMVFMFNNLPSGLSLYFVFSTVLQIIQQYITDFLQKKKGVVKGVVKTV